MTDSLTPDDAAHLLRLDARARQRDSRARKAEREAAAARLVAEREGERLAVLAAKDDRLADLERRLATTEGRLADAEQDLDDTRLLLGIILDIDEHRRRGMTPVSERIVVKHLENAGHRYRHATSRLWTCSRTEATGRAQGACQSALDRVTDLPTSDDPVTLAVDVTRPDTPVTETMRNTHGNERIADRSQDYLPIPPSQEALIDRLGPSPYDPYEAMIEEIEHRAETGVGWNDEEDHEGDESRHVDV